jgi:mannose-6-phosphate isomerase-like protein (cupin superfamily)
MGPFRRIVTGRNAAGKSVVIADGRPPAPPASIPQVLFWSTTSSPARALSVADADREPNSLRVPEGGNRIVYFEMPPAGGGTLPRATLDSIAIEMWAALGAPEVRVDARRHPFMHQTATIDYVVLLNGRITLVLDEGEVDLEPFDLVVQQGTNHAWVNKGPEPALLLGVLIDAKTR